MSTQRETTTRFVIATVRRPKSGGDHSEFDDFHQTIVRELQDEEFEPFWAVVAPDSVPAPQSSQSVRSELIDLLALLCVT